MLVYSQEIKALHTELLAVEQLAQNNTINTSTLLDKIGEIRKKIVEKQLSFFTPPYVKGQAFRLLREVDSFKTTLLARTLSLSTVSPQVDEKIVEVQPDHTFEDITQLFDRIRNLSDFWKSPLVQGKTAEEIFNTPDLYSQHQYLNQNLSDFKKGVNALNTQARQLIEKVSEEKLNSPEGIELLVNACKWDNFQVIRALIKKKIPTNKPNTNGFTPLAMACACGSLTCVNALLDSKDSAINAQDNFGETPLYKAVTQGHFDVVKRLVEKNADVNIPDNNGDTPLHFAWRNIDSKMITFLMENSADIHIKNSQNISVHQLMMKQERKALGHLWGLEGNFSIENLQSTYEGNESRWSRLQFIEQLKDFLSTESLPKHFFDSNLKRRLNLFIDNIHNSDDPDFNAAEISKKINDREPVMIMTGWNGNDNDGHEITLLFVRDYVVKCNRGDGKGARQPAIEIYKRNKAITPAAIQSLASGAIKNPDLGKAVFYGTINQPLELPPSPCKTIPMSSQTVGNCSMASIKVGLYALLNLEAEDHRNVEVKKFSDKAAKNGYKAFSSFARYNSLKKHLTETTCQDVDSKLLRAIDEKIFLKKLMPGKLNPIQDNYLSNAQALIKKKQQELKLDDQFRPLIKMFALYFEEKNEQRDYALKALLHVLKLKSSDVSAELDIPNFLAEKKKWPTYLQDYISQETLKNAMTALNTPTK